MPEKVRPASEQQGSAQYAAASSMGVQSVKTGELLALAFRNGNQHLPARPPVNREGGGVIENHVGQGALKMRWPDKHHIQLDGLALIIPGRDEEFIGALRGRGMQRPGTE